MNKRRIENEKVNLNKESLQNFFNQRTNKYNDENPLISVMYQDKNPQLAVLRDKLEKEQITPLLNLYKQSIVLDVGCGIGRWAEVVGDVHSYYGTDFNLGLIEIAKQKFSSSNFHFIHADFAHTFRTLQTLKGKVTHMIFAGVFQYLNDEELDFGLKQALEYLTDKPTIYIKVAVAADTRLTLNDYWSDELEINYSAIYRSLKEYEEILNNIFGKLGFKIVLNEQLGDENLKNRKETWQHMFILKKGD